MGRPPGVPRRWRYGIFRQLALRAYVGREEWLGGETRNTVPAGKDRRGSVRHDSAEACVFEEIAEDKGWDNGSATNKASVRVESRDETPQAVTDNP